MLSGIAGLATVAPLDAARAACSWVDSVVDWEGSLAWSYSWAGGWDDGPYHHDGINRDQVSATAELESLAPSLAQGPMEGTMQEYDQLRTSGVGAPGTVTLQGSGSIDGYAPPPPGMTLILDSGNCTYTFAYTEMGVEGTSTVQTASGSNSLDVVVGSGGLVVPHAIPLPETPQALTFSGQVEATTLPPLPPFSEPYFVPTGSAYDSANFLGDLQLGVASAQWAFQPQSFTQPLNDSCAAAPFLTAIQQDVTFATTAGSDPTPSCGAGDRSVWFMAPALGEGPASVTTAGSDYGTIVSIWPMSQACGALTTQVACGEGNATWNAEAGESYRVQITRGSGSGGSLTAVVTVPVPEAGARAAAGAACAALAALARRCRGPRRV